MSFRERPLLYDMRGGSLYISLNCCLMRCQLFMSTGRLAHKSSSKSAKRDRAPCLEARSAIVRARQVYSTRSERATLRKSRALVLGKALLDDILLQKARFSFVLFVFVGVLGSCPRTSLLKGSVG